MAGRAAVFRGFTPEELRAQYSAREAVPEHAAIFQRWRADSAAFREGATATDRAHLDLRYGAGDRERLDLFLPVSPRPAPLHVFLHGGYWQSMDRRDFSFVAAPLTAAGRAVAVVGYPLCPDVGMSTIVAAVRGAVHWLLAHAEDLEIAAEALEVSGHSAGGHLAALLACTDWPARDRALPSRPIARIRPISGVFELEPLVHTPLNQALGLDRAAARALSPLRLAPPPEVTLEAWVGARESAEFRRQSREMAEHWRRASAASWHEVPDRNHFTILDALFSPDGPFIATSANGQGGASG